MANLVKEANEQLKEVIMKAMGMAVADGKSSPHCLYCRDTRQEMHPICRNRLQLFSIYILLFTAIKYYYNKQGI